MRWWLELTCERRLGEQQAVENKRSCGRDAVKKGSSSETRRGAEKAETITGTHFRPLLLLLVKKHRFNMISTEFFLRDYLLPTVCHSNGNVNNLWKHRCCANWDLVKNPQLVFAFSALWMYVDCGSVFMHWAHFTPTYLSCVRMWHCLYIKRYS